MAYINHQGGATSDILCDLSLQLWNFCISRRIVIKASHLGGVYNCRADFLSRLSTSDHSYFLCQDIFDRVQDLLPFPLKIDLFASRLNFKLSPFISRYNDPEAVLTDAFTVPWRDFVYLFPPVPVIGRVLMKFRSDCVGHGLFVCPFWPSQAWYPSLLELLIAVPILLPTGAVQDPDRRLPKSSLLLALPIGSGRQEQRAYQRGLQSVGSEVSREILLSRTRGIGESSIIGFIGNRAVTVQLL